MGAWFHAVSVGLLLSSPAHALSSVSRPGSVLAASPAAPKLRESGLYVGLDLSTQSATAVVVDARLDVVYRTSVNFEEALPEYGTKAGMHASDDGVVTSPVAMWLDAMDEVMSRLEKARVLPQVEAFSFSGQQHGSVYWAADAEKLLKAGPKVLQGISRDRKEGIVGKGAAGRSVPRRPVHERGFRETLFPLAFSAYDSPIWADASTQLECDALEAAVGGPVALAALSGSRAYLRFTGPQMAAMAARHPRRWAATKRVGLVSSFAASCFCGRIAPVDASDATGTNLAAIHTGGREWSAEALRACGSLPGVGGAARLREVLGDKPTASQTVLGRLSSWVADRWGLRRRRDQDLPLIVAAAGDNPSSAAGLGLCRAGDVALSMGTSDTYMAVATEAKPQLEGHIFASCTDEDEFYALLCYSNGAAARLKVRDDYGLGGQATNNNNPKDWSAFDDALRRSPPGNDGLVGLEVALNEITPVIPRRGRWHAILGDDGENENQRRVLSSLGDGVRDPAAAAARAVVEGRFLSMRGRGAQLGVNLGPDARVLAAGGATKSQPILQIAADVFGAQILRADEPDAAALGAAYRAAHATLKSQSPSAPTYASLLDDLGAGAAKLDVVAGPSANAANVYTDDLVQRYLAFEVDVQSSKIK